MRPGFASEAQLYVIPPRRSGSGASGPVFGGQDGDGSPCGEQQGDSVELAISVLGRAFEANVVTEAQRRQLQLLLNKDVLADSMRAASLDDLALPDSPMPDAARIRQERPTVLSAALHECVDLQPSRTLSLAEHYRQRYGTALVSESVIPSSGDPKDELPSYRTPLVVENPELVALRAEAADLQGQLDQIKEIKDRTRSRIAMPVEGQPPPFVSNTQLLNAMTEEEQAKCRQTGMLRAKMSSLLSRMGRLDRDFSSPWSRRAPQ